MLAALRGLQASDSDLSVEVGLTPSFAASKHAGPEAYWARLAAAKVCLVPRGDTLETYRLFEAARAGCVVVGEHLPANWFYDRAPISDQTGWRDLGACLRELLSDAPALAERQRRTLEWWAGCAGPQAAGHHLARTVEAALAAEPGRRRRG